MTLKIAAPLAVIFDMDGLLLDSERVMLELQQQVAAELGLPWRREVSLRVVGLSSRDSDRIWLEAYGPHYPLEQVRERFVELYETAIHTGRIPAKPFVCELLDRLDALGIPRAVATSTRRRHAEAKLGHVQLLARMHALACGDEVTHPKPAPDIYQLAASRLGAHAQECLVLEDSNAGVCAALAARMQVVMVPDLIGPDAAVSKLGVPCVDSLHDVLTALRG